MGYDAFHRAALGFIVSKEQITQETQICTCGYQVDTIQKF